MDLVKITGNDDESEDDTYKNLKKKVWISQLLRFHFILSMGGMFLSFLLVQENFWDFTIDFHASCSIFYRLVLFKRAWISF